MAKVKKGDPKRKRTTDRSAGPGLAPTPAGGPGLSPNPPVEETETDFDFDLLDDIAETFRPYFAEGDATQLVELIKGWMLEGKRESEIRALIEQTEIYNRYFPEHQMLAEKGRRLDPGQILAMRTQYREIGRRFGLVDPSPDQLANLIANDVSLAEWEQRLGVFQRVEQFGGDVQSLFESAYGFKLSDDDLAEFFDPDIDTEELDRRYQEALFRGFGTRFGLEVLPSEIAEQLRSIGLDEGAFVSGIKTVGELAPFYQKLADIEAGIQGIQGLPPTGAGFLNETPTIKLVRGLLAEDPQAKRELQSQLARELARFAPGGGVVTSGTQAVGLLSREERRRLGAR